MENQKLVKARIYTLPTMQRAKLIMRRNNVPSTTLKKITSGSKHHPKISSYEYGLQHQGKFPKNLTIGHKAQSLTQYPKCTPPPPPPLPPSPSAVGQLSALPLPQKICLDENRSEASESKLKSKKGISNRKQVPSPSDGNEKKSFLDELQGYIAKNFVC